MLSLSRTGEPTLRLFKTASHILKLRTLLMVCSCHKETETMLDPSRRKYQVVVAATREMGIGKDGKLPWNLPSDMKFFKELTLTTADPQKKNAVLMGRKTWMSIPVEYRPLRGRLNVIVSGSMASHSKEHVENVLVYNSISSALESLAEEPLSSSIERVYIIGGSQILRETLNGDDCEAIHITEIETNIPCDTFIPEIDTSRFTLWCSSAPILEQGIRYRFSTYIRSVGQSVISADALSFQNLSSLPQMIIHNRISYK